jgi:hypothetical protein
VEFARTDVSEELIPSIIRMTRVGELGTNLIVTSNRSTLRRNTIVFNPDNRGDSSSETSVLRRATRPNIPEDGSLHCFIQNDAFGQYKRTYNLGKEIGF